MEIRQILYFVEVVKAGSYSLAAKQLYISQPALSKAVKNLEQTFGAKLLTQVENRMEPTDVGRVLYEKSQQLIDDYNTLMDSVNEVSELKKGWIRFGIPYGLGKLLLYDMTAAFHQLHPNIELNISGHGSRYIRTAVAEGRLDLGATIIPPAISAEIDHHVICRDRYFLLVHRAHRLAQQSQVSFSELAEENFIMLNEEFAMTEMTNLNCRAAGFTPKVSMIANRSDFIADMVMKNSGIAVIAGGRWRYDGMEELACLDLTDGQTEFDIALVTPKNSYQSFAVRAFLNFAPDFLRASEHYGTTE